LRAQAVPDIVHRMAIERSLLPRYRLIAGLGDLLLRPARR
jgi:hypothetical protein